MNIRRTVMCLSLGLAALCVAWAAPAMIVPAGDAINFSVFRKNDSPMGSHTVRFTREGDTLIMEKEIRLEVTLAFITAYRYEHSNREVWKDGRLIAIDTKTDDDGDQYWLRGRATDEGFLVEGTRGTVLAPADIIPTSYWNIATTKATQLLDTQRGLIMDVRIEDKGEEMVETATGPLQARHHTINILSNLPGSTDKIELWYDAAGAWVALGFQAKGQPVNYVLDAPAVAPAVLPPQSAAMP